MKLRNRSGEFKQDVNMTSMIDVVFLLLVFFMVTLKIVVQEGDFGVRMPLGTRCFPDNSEMPLRLCLKADHDGRLASMAMNDSQLGTDFDALRNTVIKLVGYAKPGAESSPEIEIDTDYNLRYEYVIQSITAVSGYKVGDQTVKLIEKIKFAKPRR